MGNYEIDIVDIISQAFAERELSLKEYKKQQQICDKMIEFIDTFNEKQHAMFKKLEVLVSENRCCHEDNLIKFVLKFVSSTRM